MVQYVRFGFGRLRTIVRAAWFRSTKHCSRRRVRVSFFLPSSKPLFRHDCKERGLVGSSSDSFEGDASPLMVASPNIFRLELDKHDESSPFNNDTSKWRVREDFGSSYV